MRFLLTACMLAFVLPAVAEEDIHHHAGASANIDKFYSGWLVPHGGAPRVYSCCNRVDCAKADIKRENGRWYGRRAIDASWLIIPDGLLESNQGDPRESPDGQSHLCVSWSGTVLCAVLGSGI